MCNINSTFFILFKLFLLIFIVARYIYVKIYMNILILHILLTIFKTKKNISRFAFKKYFNFEDK
jgi:hypothetical protein